MSIKSDKWIRKMCIRPYYHVQYGIRRAGRLIEVAENVPEDWELPAGAVLGRKTVLSEEFRAHWKPLISPFVDGQIREREIPNVAGFPALDKARPELVTEPNMAVIHKNLYHVPGPKEKIISFGTSSFGYDVRLARTFKVFTNVHNGLIDPLNMKDDYYVDKEGDFVIIPPNSYILGHTVEVFDIPRDVMVVALGKSTYARCGAIVNVTPIEAEFRGQVVIEISNSTPLPLKVYAGMGIAQFLFFQSDEECDVSYADRGGKYQGQSGITTAKV